MSLYMHLYVGYKFIYFVGKYLHLDTYLGVRYIRYTGFNIDTLYWLLN